MKPFYLLMACLLFFALAGVAQRGKVITGRVTSGKQTLEGVTVTEKNTTNRVVTDASGNSQYD